MQNQANQNKGIVYQTDELVFPAARNNSLIKRVLLCSFSYLSAGLNQLMGSRASDCFGVLMYHRISAQPLDGYLENCVSRNQFEKQIHGLLDRGYVFWPLEKLIYFTSEEKCIPNRVVTITFDDGYLGIFKYVYPLVCMLELPITIFLSTAFLNSKEKMPFDQLVGYEGKNLPEDVYYPLTSDQCIEMAESGYVHFGSHTHTHQDFRGREELFRQDITKSKIVLEELFPNKTFSFAFPYGTPSLGFAGGELQEIIKETGFSCALNTKSSLVAVDCRPYQWGRFNVFSWDTGATLGGKLGGWYSWGPQIWQKIRMRKFTDIPAVPERIVTTRDVERENRKIKENGFENRVTGLPLLSVIIPTYNRAEWLRDGIESLLNQKTENLFEYELVIADNDSTDHTKEVVEQYIATSSLQIRYVAALERGDGVTRNEGIAIAEGSWFAFFDDDQLADHDWLYQLWFAAQYLSAKVVGGRVLLDLSQDQRASMHVYFRQLLRETEAASFYTTYKGNIYPSTGNVLVAREVMDRIGLFDSSMAAGGSDYDFFIRARRQGIPLWYNSEARIRHRIPASRLTHNYQKIESLSGGAVTAAGLDLRFRGLMYATIAAVARLAKGGLHHLPIYLLSFLTRDHKMREGHRIRLWRVEGYVRRVLSELFPQICRQESFFRSFTFEQRSKPQVISKQVSQQSVDNLR